MPQRRRILWLAWAPGCAAALLMVALGGCGGGQGQQPPAAAPPAAPAALSGKVHGGNNPVSAASVLAYAAGDGNAGTSATLLACVQTDGSGNFAFGDTHTAACGSGAGSGQPTNFLNCTGCPDGTRSQIYLVAVGGNPGLTAGTNNTALTLLAALGPYLGLPASGVDISELTTVAAIYSLAQMMGAGNATLPSVLANDQLINAPSPGLANAFARALSLVSTASQPGSALSGMSCTHSTTDPVNCGALEKLDTLADALAACVNTAGSGSSACLELFCDATAGANFDRGAGSCSVAAVPADTLQSALSIALNPGVISVADLNALGGTQTPFAPTLGSAPSDWTLSLNFSGGGLNEPTAVAVDAANRVWVADYSGAVSAFDALGNALSPATGYTGGGLEESFGLAVAPGGDIWITNEQSAGNINGGLGSLTILAPDGSVVSGGAGYGGGLDFPVAIAFDPSGNAWIADDGNATVASFAAAGTARSPSSGFGGSGLGFSSGVAIDGSGNAWLSNLSTNAVTELAPDGSPLSGANGFTGGGLNGPSAIALDASGNVWVTNYYGDSLSLLSPAGLPLAGSPFSGGGLRSPAGAAIDGAGQVWVTNYHGNSISRFAAMASPTPGAALSPADGFIGAGLSEPYAPVIDQAGNLWTANFGNNSLTEFVGVAVPVKTPTNGLPVRL